MNARTAKTLWTTTLLSMAVVGALAASAAQAREAAFNEGRLLVKLNAGVPEAEFALLLKRNMSQEIRHIEALGLRVVRVPKQFEQTLAATLSADARVQFAELDSTLQPREFIPNDPYYGYEWHLPKIGATAAWDFTQGEGVTVAVLDSGVDAAHPDLVANLIAGYNTVSDNTQTQDVFGHGTKVAGIIAANTNNGLGIASVAGGVALMPIRVSEAADGYAYASDVAEGLLWAAQHGARVANVSYDLSGSSAITAAAAYLRQHGGVVVMPAGNDGLTLDLPDNPEILLVSATTSSDELASWSNRGTHIDLSAPGLNIPTTTIGGGYGQTAGTSFATPVVSATAALVIAANPSLTADEVEQILENSAVDLGAPGWDSSFGHGRIDAAAAVQLALAWTAPAADTQVPSVAITSPAASAQVSGTLSVQITASDNVGVTSVKLYAGATLIGSDTAAPYAINLNTTTYANGALQLTARAYDAAGNEALSSAVAVTVYNAPADTTAPTATITAPTANKTVSGTVTVKSIAADNVAVATMTLYIDNVKLCTGTSTALNCAWNAAAATRGTHVIKLTATDTSGNAKTTQVSVKR